MEFLLRHKSSEQVKWFFFMCKIKNREVPYRFMHGLAFETWCYSQAGCLPSQPEYCFSALPRLAVCSSSMSLAHSQSLCSHTTPCPYLLFVISIMCSLQAHTGRVGQQGDLAWHEEEQLTFVHFITWPQITSLNKFNSFIILSVIHLPLLHVPLHQSLYPSCGV